MTNRWLDNRTRSGDAYDATYDARAAAGEDVHGEANFVQRLGVRSVLDAGCGTGRVGRELGRRGLRVAGVDLDPVMLRTAQAKAPYIEWTLADLSTFDLGRRFEAIVMAGNVMIFLTPGSEATVVAKMAQHLDVGGYLVAGFQLMRGRLSLEQYDALATEAGLRLTERWATWDCGAWQPGGDYAISVHRAPDRIADS